MPFSSILKSVFTTGKWFFRIALIFTIKIFYSIHYWSNSYFKIFFGTVVNRINSSVKKIMLFFKKCLISKVMLFFKKCLTLRSCCSSKSVLSLTLNFGDNLLSLCLRVFTTFCRRGFSHMQWFLGHTWMYGSKILCCGNHSRYFYKVSSSPFPPPLKMKLQQANKLVRKWNYICWDIWWMTPCKYEWKNIC